MAAVDREGVLNEAEAVVVGFIREMSCWGSQRMIDCSVDDMAADISRLFADLRGEPRPGRRRDDDDDPLAGLREMQYRSAAWQAD